MKDFLYLDSQLVSSMLSQLDNGLILKLITGIDTGETDTESYSQENSVNAGGGINTLVVAASTNYVGMEGNVKSSSNSEINRSSQEIILDDYIFNLLLDKLNEENSLLYTFSDDMESSNLFLVESKIEIFDFEQLDRITNNEVLNKMNETSEVIKLKKQLDILKSNKKKSSSDLSNIEILKKQIESMTNDFTDFISINSFAKVASEIIPESCLISLENGVAVCPNKNLRMNKPTMSLTNTNAKKAKILGSIINKKERDLSKIDNFQAKQAYIIPSVMLDILLTSFSITKIGDYYIRPIAIYFEP